jgi:hypothetical protein
LKQYTRLTFNSNNWKKPSGKGGKSTNQNSFEGLYHFGFEEWLFDESTLINAKKYAFIQGVASSTIKRKAPKELILYTINKHTLERLHIATLHKWEYFVDGTKLNIQNQFEANAWLTKMHKEVQAVNANVNMFDIVVANKGKSKQYEPLFNISFEYKDLDILPQPKVFPKGHKIYGLHRYKIYEF